MARDFARIDQVGGTEWRRRFDEDYAHLDPIERKYALRAALDHKSTRPRISDSIRLAVYRRDGYACGECGRTDRLSLDHVWPYSKGGEDTLENLQTLCVPCNSRKGAAV